MSIAVTANKPKRVRPSILADFFSPESNSAVRLDRLFLAQRTVNFLRRKRQIEEPDAAGIGDGVGDRRGGRRVGVFGDLLAAERRRPRRTLDQDSFKRRDVAYTRELRFAQIRRRDLTVDHDILFHQAKTDPRDNAAVDLPGEREMIEH